MSALRAKRLKRSGIADRVARLACPANLRGPSWSFVFSVFDMTGDTARTRNLSHRKEQPTAIAARHPTESGSVRGAACAGGANAVGSGAQLPPRCNTEGTKTPRRITERRAMEMAVIAWNQVRPGRAWAGLSTTRKFKTMKANSSSLSDLPRRLTGCFKILYESTMGNSYSPRLQKSVIT